MAKYRKVDPRIWNDAKFRQLSDEAKLVTFLLLTHPHMTAVGAMRGTPEGFAAEMKWSAEAFREAFQEVCQKGIAKYDEEASFIWLPKFLKYNPPESPNVVKAWSESLEELPECDLLYLLIQEVKGYLEAKGKGFREALPEAFEKASLYQEQEQEQDIPPTQDPNLGKAVDSSGEGGARVHPLPAKGQTTEAPARRKPPSTTAQAAEQVDDDEEPW